MTRNRSELPAADEVHRVYRAAAAEPPLNEQPRAATVFSNLYAESVEHEEVLAAFVRDGGGDLVSFAYGHPWAWAEQQYAWADQLKQLLGDAAGLLDGSHSLSLLARDPNHRRRGLGRDTLLAWLDELAGISVWLQTTDIESPARRLYEELGFVDIGRGPDAPDGRPGLVMLR